MADPQVIAQLRDILAELYPDTEQAKRILSEAGVNIIMVEFSDTPIILWDSILDEVIKNGRDDDLLGVVLDEYGRNKALRSAYSAFRAMSIASPIFITATPASVSPPVPINPTPATASRRVLLVIFLTCTLVALAVGWMLGIYFRGPTEGPEAQLPESPVVRTTFQEIDKSVVMEAENYSVQIPGSGRSGGLFWEDTEGPKYSNGSAIQANSIKPLNLGTLTTGPSLIYQIVITNTGVYTVDVRGEAPMGDRHDSVHVGLYGDPVTVSDGSGTGVGFQEDLHWVHRYCESTPAGGGQCLALMPTTVHIPAAGTYNLQIWMRENGVILDKIIMSGEIIQNDTVKTGLPETVLQWHR